MAKGKAGKARETGEAMVGGAGPVEVYKGRFTAPDGTEYEAQACSVDELIAALDALKARTAPNDGGQPNQPSEPGQ